MVTAIAFASPAWPPASRAVGSLDLASTLREAAAASPTLAARRARVEAMRLRAGAAGAWPAPEVELGIVNVPTRGGLDADPMTMRAIGFSLALPLFGRKGPEKRSAESAWRSEAAAAELAAFESMGEVWQSYADAFFAQELVRDEPRHHELMNRMVRTAVAGYATTRGEHHEMVRAEAERARVLADLAEFRAEEQRSRARLGALMGRPSPVSDEVLLPPPMPAVPADSAAWLDAITPDHPGLRQHTEAAESHARAARAARRSAWPDLTLRGSYGVREDLRMGSVTVPQDPLVSASVAFALPLAAGWSQRAEGAALEAMARAARAEREAAEQELRAEVVAAHAAARSAQRALRLLADTVLVAQRRWLESAYGAYAAQATDLSALLEASHALLTAEIDLIRARIRLSGAHARLVALTGRTDLLGVPLPPGLRWSR